MEGISMDIRTEGKKGFRVPIVSTYERMTNIIPVAMRELERTILKF